MHVVEKLPATSASTPTATRRRVFATSLMVGAALVAASAGIHGHLWASGYRNIPTIGTMFLLQAMAAPRWPPPWSRCEGSLSSWPAPRT